MANWLWFEEIVNPDAVYLVQSGVPPAWLPVFVDQQCTNSLCKLSFAQAVPGQYKFFIQNLLQAVMPAVMEVSPNQCERDWRGRDQRSGCFRHPTVINRNVFQLANNFRKGVCIGNTVNFVEMSANQRFRQGIGTLLLKLPQDTGNNSVSVFALPTLLLKASRYIGFEFMADKTISKAGKQRICAIYPGPGQPQKQAGSAGHFIEEPTRSDIRVETNRHFRHGQL